MPECPFCQGVAGPSWFLTREEPGHALLVPRRHVTEVTELNEAELVEMIPTLKRYFAEMAITSYQLKVNGPGYRHVEHLHIHILAKKGLAQMHSGRYAP